MITLIGARCTHSNVFSQGLLITRILLGNMTSTYSDSYHHIVYMVVRLFFFHGTVVNYCYLHIFAVKSKYM